MNGADYAISALIFALTGTVIFLISNPNWTRKDTKHLSIAVTGALTLIILVFLAGNPEITTTTICEATTPYGTRTTEGGSTNCA